MTAAARPSRHLPTDLALDNGAGARLIATVSGLMVFFVTLALALTFSLSTLTRDWAGGLSGVLTAEIRPPLPSAEDGKVSPQDDKAFRDTVRRAEETLKKNPAVRNARVLSDAEVKKLIAPWMGDVPLDAVPMPALIDIGVHENADIAALENEIKKISPFVALDRHGDTVQRVRTLAGAASLFFLLLTGVIAALAAVVTAGIVGAKLRIHQTEVETLHLIGASDDYIAGQFRRHALGQALRGAAAGSVLALLVLAGLAAVTRTLDAGMFVGLRLAPLEWAVLLLAPPGAGAVIAHLAAQTAVLHEMAKRP